MNAYLQLTMAQLRIFARNRAVIFFTLLFPLVLMIALGSFLGKGGGISLNASIIDYDNSTYSQKFVESLNSNQLISTTVETEETQALDLLKKGEKQIVVIIPKEYGKKIDSLQKEVVHASESDIPLRVFYDETNQAVSQVGLTLINEVADNISKELVHYKQSITVDAKGIQAVKLSYIDFLVPGIVAMMIMSTNLNGVSGQIASWRERGILRRMQSTPLKASTFIAAQITARLLLNVLQAMIVLLVGNLLFHTQVNGSWILLIIFVVLGTLTFMSIGFIIAGLAKTPESAGPISVFISFPLMFLGGVFFPINNMPAFLLPIVKMLPITHLSSSLRQVMNVGADLNVLWPDAALLGGWMIAAYLLASYTFKWE